MKSLGLFFVFVFMLGSVSTGVASTEESRTCRYRVLTDTMKVQFTGFKTTEKVPVSGTFKNVKLNAPKISHSVSELLLNSNATIDFLSVFTDNDARDWNLREHFFKKIKNYKKVQGKIRTTQGSNHKGTAVLGLNLNGRTKDVTMEYVTEPKNANTVLLRLNGELDILDFKMNRALASISQACFELHKGPDGISKTWPNFQIKIEVELEQACD
jgi:polyisoprenoid-binding protein YceI